MQRSIAGAFIITIVYLCSQSACKPKFSTTGAWKDTTIVYGLLDISDTAHYIRIYKGYLDPNVNAYTQAKIPDSIYYPAAAITADLYQVDSNTGQTIKTLPLTRVDGSKEGLNMDTGIFAQSPNILYKTNARLVRGALYKLQIINKGKEKVKVITAKTKTVDSIVTIAPGRGQTALNFFPHSKYTFVWNPVANAAIYDLTLTLHLKEIYKGDTQNKSVVWNVFSNLGQSTQPEYGVTGDGFYNILANKLPDAPAGMTREFSGIDFQLSAGGNELYAYYLNSIANSGITQGQVVKGYTNINNGVGLFSSRVNRRIQNLQVSSRVLDSLACYYPNLHFLNHIGKLCNP